MITGNVVPAPLRKLSATVVRHTPTGVDTGPAVPVAVGADDVGVLVCVGVLVAVAVEGDVEIETRN
jgi:hypothetical protein